MNDVIHSLAQDFSAHFMIKNVASEPIDTYLGPLTKILGKDPGRDDILAALDSKCEDLKNAFEISVASSLDVEFVKSVFKQGVRNFYGPSVDDLFD